MLIGCLNYPIIIRASYLVFRKITKVSRELLKVNMKTIEEKELEELKEELERLENNENSQKRIKELYLLIREKQKDIQAERSV